MIFIEPVLAYRARMAKPVVRYVAPSDPLLGLSREQQEILEAVPASPQDPIRFTSVVNTLSKRQDHRRYADRERYKRDLFIKIGALIRAGHVRRFKRKYVCR